MAAARLNTAIPAQFVAAGSIVILSRSQIAFIQSSSRLRTSAAPLDTTWPPGDDAAVVDTHLQSTNVHTRR